jgi:hypothetical protein
VTIFGSYFATWDYKKIVSLGQVVDFGVIPEPVVVGYANAVEADSLCLLYQLVRRDKTVNRCWKRVRVDVYYQTWFSGPHQIEIRHSLAL